MQAGNIVINPNTGLAYSVADTGPVSASQYGQGATVSVSGIYADTAAVSAVDYSGLVSTASEYQFGTQGTAISYLWDGYSYRIIQDGRENTIISTVGSGLYSPVGSGLVGHSLANSGQVNPATYNGTLVLNAIIIEITDNSNSVSNLLENGKHSMPAATVSDNKNLNTPTQSLLQTKYFWG